MLKLVDKYFDTNKIPLGTKIKFAEEKQRYTVRSSNVAFTICTKPFNLYHTVLYTIIDFNNSIRGAEDLIFGVGAESDEECNEMLERLTNAESGISYRNNIPLAVESLILK